MIMLFYSLVESEHPVSHAKPEGSNTIHTPVATVLSVNPTHKGLMSAIAEGSVGAHLAVAKLVIT